MQHSLTSEVGLLQSNYNDLVWFLSQNPKKDDMEDGQYDGDQDEKMMSPVIQFVGACDVTSLGRVTPTGTSEPYCTEVL